MCRCPACTGETGTANPCAPRDYCTHVLGGYPGLPSQQKGLKMAPKTTLNVSEVHQLDYALLRRIVQGCGGWIRSSSSDNDEAKVWFEDTEYVFSGRGLIGFLYAVKDENVDALYAAKDLVDYIEGTDRQPPSRYVLDAIRARTAEFKAKAFPDETERTS